MATLWIREYASVGAAPSGLNSGAANLPVVAEPGTDQTALTFSTTAASAAFGAATSYIIVVSSVDCHYVVATAPTATTAALKIPANTPWAIGVTAGHKIAAIAAA
tara:strand:+ start:3747 stop:4061 length:315 start_codon:yes stop_codon:yes gene_type:complete